MLNIKNVIKELEEKGSIEIKYGDMLIDLTSITWNDRNEVNVLVFLGGRVIHREIIEHEELEIYLEFNLYYIEEDLGLQL